jgi:hypothetical protein
MLIFALAYQGRNFLFVFCENWKNQNALSKLSDLYNVQMCDWLNSVHTSKVHIQLTFLIFIQQAINIGSA